MNINAAKALAAYGLAAKRGETAPMEDPAAASSFAAAVRKSVEDAIAVNAEGERAALQGLLGTSSLQDVVTAVAAAEVSLQAIVTIRDRAIQAYQEIMRMPI